MNYKFGAKGSKQREFNEEYGAEGSRKRKELEEEGKGPSKAEKKKWDGRADAYKEAEKAKKQHRLDNRRVPQRDGSHKVYKDGKYVGTEKNGKFTAVDKKGQPKKKSKAEINKEEKARAAKKKAEEAKKQKKYDNRRVPLRGGGYKIYKNGKYVGTEKNGKFKPK